MRGFHFHACLGGIISLTKHPRRRGLVEVTFAAVVTDLRRHGPKDDRRTVSLKEHGDLARGRLPVLADNASHSGNHPRKELPAGGRAKNAAITYSRLATTIGRAGLTTVFGMVTGVTLHVLSPHRQSYTDAVWCQGRVGGPHHITAEFATHPGTGGAPGAVEKLSKTLHFESFCAPFEVFFGPDLIQNAQFWRQKVPLRARSSISGADGRECRLQVAPASLS